MTNLLCAQFDASNFLFAFLLAFSGVLVTVICVVVGMLVQRRNADVNRLKKHVYVKETWAKSADCDNITQKSKSNKPQKDVPKKLRHGKKNKLAKVMKEASE